MLTDYHCHLIPGIDDGPTELETSLEMASTLVSAGFTRICCTPHRICGVYDASPPRVRRETRRLQDELDRAGIAVELVAGCEYYLDEFYPEFIEIDPLLLPGNLLLAEIPARCADFDAILSLVTLTVDRGLIPLIAHPERSPLLSPSITAVSTTLRSNVSSLFRDSQRPDNQELTPPPFIEILLKSGCRFQGNFGSFAGYYGESARQYACFYQQSGYYSCFGSDAHQPQRLSDYLQKGMIATGIVSVPS